MSEQSNEIHDMIQCFDLGASPELIASRLLDILQAVNKRMDSIEVDLERQQLLFESRDKQLKSLQTDIDENRPI